MRFSKYHGLGNDFIVVDLRAPAADERAGRDTYRVQDPAVVQALCDRRFGVGADGVLAILPSHNGADARMRVLNADGSEAEMCGNGLRCVVKHLVERDSPIRRAGTPEAMAEAMPNAMIDALVIETGAGLLRCNVSTRGSRVESVNVNMGRPRMERGEVPMTGPASERCVSAPLRVAGQDLVVTTVSMGNPHAIAFVDASGPALRALAESVGPGIELHDWFPRRTNAEFAHVASPTDIELVVWERGCGITLACGTGACATAVAACLTGRARTNSEITVRLLGGALAIEVAEDYSAVWMRGPATHVFDAEVDLDHWLRP